MAENTKKNANLENANLENANLNASAEIDIKNDNGTTTTVITHHAKYTTICGFETRLSLKPSKEDKVRIALASKHITAYNKGKEKAEQGAFEIAKSLYFMKKDKIYELFNRTENGKTALPCSSIQVFALDYLKVRTTLCNNLIQMIETYFIDDNGNFIDKGKLIGDFNASEFTQTQLIEIMPCFYGLNDEKDETKKAQRVKEAEKVANEITPKMSTKEVKDVRDKYRTKTKGDNKDKSNNKDKEQEFTTPADYLDAILKLYNGFNKATKGYNVVKDFRNEMTKINDGKKALVTLRDAFKLDKVTKTENK